MSLFAQADLLTAINKISIPITTFSADSNFSDIGELSDILKDKQIVALGEATHGTREFFLLKHRIVRYLITVLKVKTFVIEADFSGAILMNDYIINGNGDAYHALKAMGIGFWINDDFIDLIDWIREYNLTKNNNEKVSFYGCDMQAPVVIANGLRKGTIKTQKPLSKECKEGLNFITNLAYQAVDSETKQLLYKTVAELKTIVLLESDFLKKNRYKYAINTIEQAVDFYINSNRKSELRDKFMAENCMWIYKNESNKKMVIWAHNLHVCKNVHINTSFPMGYYLSEKFKNQYYSFGFGFNSGTVRAWSVPSGLKTTVFNVPKVTSKNSSDYVFSLSSSPNFILDFRACAGNKLLDVFIHKKQYSRAIGFSYTPKKLDNGKTVYRSLISLYDGIIFIRTTMAALPEITED